LVAAVVQVISIAASHKRVGLAEEEQLRQPPISALEQMERPDREIKAVTLLKRELMVDMAPVVAVQEVPVIAPHHLER
jgi:hypothetical protein